LAAFQGLKYDRLQDEEIILAFKKNRDPELLGLLYKRYMLLVYGVSLKYLKNREDSQDAVMQIFEILNNDIPRFEISNFKGWLYTVTKNHCLMILRQRKKEKNFVVPDENEVFFMESDTFLHPLDNMDNNDRIIINLKECMEQLNENQRFCVEWFYYQHKCYREIASELKLEEGKVKSYIQNGKRNLRICMDQQKIIKHA
jgi:RNA polymerase sigma-70 factor, ECF subfamily